MELLTSAAPVAMLAMLTLSVYVNVMLLRQKSKTSFVSRDTLSVCKDPLRPGVACPTCLTIEIVINQSVCLLQQSLCPLVEAEGPCVCVCVCLFVGLFV